MKKVTLAGLGILTISTLTLGAQAAFATVEQPEAKSDATVLFEADTVVKPEEPPIITPPTGKDDEGELDEDGSDINIGDGSPSFNLIVSNFRFNDRADNDEDFTTFKPIKLNANGMTLWAKGTQLTLKKLNADGTLAESGEKTVYENIPNFVQVTDNRGANTGWNLTVTAGEFKGDDKGTEITLKGAKLKLHQPSLKGPAGIKAPTTFGLNEVKELGSEEQLLMSATVNDGVSGTGSWSLKFGEEETVGSNTYETLKKDTGVSLTIPASAQAKAGVAYKAKLNWVLRDTPAS